MSAKGKPEKANIQKATDFQNTGKLRQKRSVRNFVSVKRQAL